MTDLKMTIQLESTVLPGSGEGYGAVIDSDAVYDELGLPYLPGRRIKGLLRDAALDGVALTGGALAAAGALDEEAVARCFGTTAQAGVINVENLLLEPYSDWQNWIGYARGAAPGVFSREAVIRQFTEIRRQTAIDPATGTAKKNSLRTMRLLRAGLQFSGTVSVDERYLPLMELAVLSLRRMGTSRNRGNGRISCQLEGTDNQIRQELEALCK